MLSSDEFPTYGYAYGEKSDLLGRLEVPCHDTKLTISELPDKANNKIIYGYIELKSENYYYVDQLTGRIKQRANMKMYFRSGLFTQTK
jgi:hypothetical protein